MQFIYIPHQASQCIYCVVHAYAGVAAYSYLHKLPSFFLQKLKANPCLRLKIMH